MTTPPLLMCEKSSIHNLGDYGKMRPVIRDRVCAVCDSAVTLDVLDI